MDIKTNIKRRMKVARNRETERKIIRIKIGRKKKTKREINFRRMCGKSGDVGSREEEEYKSEEDGNGENKEKLTRRYVYQRVVKG